MKEEICSNNKNLVNDKQIIFVASTILFYLITLSLSYAHLQIANSIFTMTPMANAQQQRPDIQASNVYQKHELILGNNIKNLIITIPNEVHEPPGLLPKDLRDANQPYFPQNSVISPGTTVTWFNVDVGHFHQIKLADSSKRVIYDSGTFPNFVASKPVKLNNTGTYTFYEAGLDKKYPKFVLNGTLTVPSQLPSVSATNSTSSVNNIASIVAFMVPTNQQDKLISDLKTLGFGVDNLYTFKTPRGVASGEGCGDKDQSLLILTSSDNDPNGVITRLKQVAPTLPCT